METEMLNVFGARLSKDGSKLLLTLVSGDGEGRKFYSACIKLDNTQKTHAKVEKDGKHAVIKVVMLDKKSSDETPF